MRRSGRRPNSRPYRRIGVRALRCYQIKLRKSIPTRGRRSFGRIGRKERFPEQFEVPDGLLRLGADDPLDKRLGQIVFTLGQCFGLTAITLY